MTFNRIQLLRNKPMKVAREIRDLYLYVQIPTIGDIYEDDKLFLISQILMMKEEELKTFLNIENNQLNKLQMLSLLLEQETDEHDLFEKIKRIILDISIKKGIIFVGAHPLKPIELNRISEILQIGMGQKNQMDEPEEELSEEELKLKKLEEKIQAKKQQQKEESSKVESEENRMEDIMISVMFEFDLSLENIMNMNYFTLIWYYSYTSKLHVYRINQHAISSGMVKKINTDYFTGLK